MARLRTFGLGRGVADVLADQVVTGDVDQVALRQVAHPVQQLGHAQSLSDSFFSASTSTVASSGSRLRSFSSCS
jgi:hypothetical protein